MELKGKKTLLTISNDSGSIDESVRKLKDNLWRQTTTGNTLSLSGNSTIKLSFFNHQGHLSWPVSGRL